jgi:hypothetical protein
MRHERIIYLCTHNLDTIPNSVNKSGAIPIESRMAVALIKSSDTSLYVRSWHIDPAIRTVERIRMKIQPEERLNP